MVSLSRKALANAVAGVTSSGLVKLHSVIPALSSTASSSAQQDEIARDELPYPLVLVPTQPELITLQQTQEWIVNTQPHLETLLSMSGSLFFRGFPTPIAQDFAEFVESFQGWNDLPYEDSLSYAVRLRVCKRVCTTNEGKRGGLIFHHELAQAPCWPSKLFFFCELPSPIGGGTAITPSWRVLQELKKSYPSFVTDCQQKQVVYRSIFPPEHDSSKGVGRSWKSFFGKDSREAVQQKMDELGYSGSWDEAGCLHLQSPVLPAIRTLPDGTEVFFNQMIAQHLANAAEFSAQAQDGDSGRLDQFLRYGDGSSVDAKALEFAYQISEKFSAELKWQVGDIALIDNLLMMHARREFDGPRKVFASLVQ